MINKDFLKDVLMEKKRLFTISEVKFVNVPMYDELSVKNLYPMMIQHPEFAVCMPDYLPLGS